MSKCVHTEHCCRAHGCKYGNDDCPVWLGYKPQSYPCEVCSDEVNWESTIDGWQPVHLKDVPKIPYTEFLDRREESRERFF